MYKGIFIISHCMTLYLLVITHTRIVHITEFSLDALLTLETIF